MDGKECLLLYKPTKECFNLACAHGKGRKPSGYTLKILILWQSYCSTIYARSPTSQHWEITALSSSLSRSPVSPLCQGTPRVELETEWAQAMPTLSYALQWYKRSAALLSIHYWLDGDPQLKTGGLNVMRNKSIMQTELIKTLSYWMVKNDFNNKYQSLRKPLV